MFNIKSSLLFLLLYFSLLVGFAIDENLNYGSYSDWLNAYVPVIKDFSLNFQDTLINFEKYGHRHSPFYIIILSLIYKLGFDLNVIRLLHLHACLALIFLFYNCLRLRFYKIEKSYLQILSMFIFLSPTFRSLSIWPDSRLMGLIFFVLSIFFFLKFLNKDFKKKKLYAYLSSFFLVVSSYISPNFSLFCFFFYFYFFKFFSIKDFFILIFFNTILSIPMLYYIFIMNVNFITAGLTPGYDETPISLNFNFSNKLILISTIFYFHLFPIIYILTCKNKFLLFVKDKFIFFLLIYLILIYLFNYQIFFTGGGFFFQLSFYIFNNNIFFYLCGFYTLFYLYYFMNLHKSNLVLVIILISSNIQNTIYHKYYEPLILIIVFLLFKNLNFESFFSKKINILYVYLSSFFYVLLRLIKNVYFS